MSAHNCALVSFLIYVHLFTGSASAESIYPSFGFATPSLQEIFHWADSNFQPSNDMATYAVPASSITVNMHIPKNENDRQDCKN